MNTLLSSMLTLIITLACIALMIYVACRIITPFVIDIITAAKEKKERNAIVIEALKGRIQYYERMIEATQSEELIAEYQEKILALEYELNK